jgi:hypothetical protein
VPHLAHRFVSGWPQLPQNLVRRDFRLYSSGSAFDSLKSSDRPRAVSIISAKWTLRALPMLGLTSGVYSQRKSWKNWSGGFR